MNKNSKIDKRIDFFKERITFYQQYFGLLSYNIAILPQTKENTCATTYFGDSESDKANRRITIAYTLSFITNPKTTLEEIDKTAFHEICEVFLGKLRDMASIGISELHVDNEIHLIIRTLENTLFSKIKSTHN
jgi:hypothetical protein